MRKEAPVKLLTHRLLMRLLGATVAIAIAASCSTTAAQGSRANFDRQTLESMLAPIALYPDALLSQVLMASTYPDEVVVAARWSRARPGLSGDAAVRTSEGWDWDPSVRSLLAFPQLLDTMARNMRWTEDLGDAFLDQRWDVMDAVQRLRRRAYEAGTLRSDDYARVVDGGNEIVIESYAPQIVYVPYYDPGVIYGSWWWPSRPPMFWPRWPSYIDPPGRPQHPIHWGPGIGISAGFFFGGIIWPQREVRVINSNAYYYPRPVVVERRLEVPPPPRRDAAPGVWRHDASRRHPPEARDARQAQEQKVMPAAPRSADIRQSPAGTVPSRAAPVPNRPGEIKPVPGPRRDAAPSPTLVAPTRDSAPSARVAQPDAHPRPATPAGPPTRAAGRADRDDAEPAAARAERRAEPRAPTAGGSMASPSQNRPERADRQESRSDPGQSEPDARTDDGARQRRSGDGVGRSERERGEAPGRPSEPGTAGAGPARNPPRPAEGPRMPPNR
jgi:hypothetical protein